MLPASECGCFTERQLTFAVGRGDDTKAGQGAAKLPQGHLSSFPGPGEKDHRTAVFQDSLTEKTLPMRIKDGTAPAPKDLTVPWEMWK